MSYLASDDAVHRINLNEGFYEPLIMPDGRVTAIYHEPFDASRNWVEIVDELTEYDRRRLMSASEDRALETRDAGSAIRIVKRNHHDQLIMYFLHVIKDWSLTENGRPLARNEDTFRRLGPVANWLATAIDTHYYRQQITVEQLGNFEAARSRHISAMAASHESSETFSSPDGSAALTPIESDSYERAQSA